MDPKDFLSTARNLKDSTSESDIRTSIGRSYYSVFLYLREQLKSLGIEKQVYPEREAHEFISYSLEFCNIKEGSKIGNKLRSLRQYRKDADYNLSIAFSNTTSDDILLQSMSLIKEFENLNPGTRSSIALGAKKVAILKNWMRN